MKQFFTILMIIMISFVSCAKKQNSFIDLTSLDDDSVYEEIFNMCIMSEKYAGKTIKVNGTFNSFLPNDKNERVYMIVVNDKQACCKQGLEFKTDSKLIFPEDFPAVDSKITLTGKFIKTVTREGYDYFYLDLISIE